MLPAAWALAGWPVTVATNVWRSNEKRRSAVIARTVAVRGTSWSSAGIDLLIRRIPRCPGDVPASVAKEDIAPLVFMRSLRRASERGLPPVRTAMIGGRAEAGRDPGGYVDANISPPIAATQIA